MIDDWITPDIAAHARHLQSLGKQITAHDWGAFTDRCEEAGADKEILDHLRRHQKGPSNRPDCCIMLEGIIVRATW